MMNPDLANAIIAFGTVWGVIVSIVLFYIGLKAAKFDKVEARLEEKSGQLIDARFKALSDSIAGPLQNLKDTIQGLTSQVNATDADVEKEKDEKHKLTLRFQSLMESLKWWADDRFAAKDALGQVVEELGQLHERFTAHAARHERT